MEQRPMIDAADEDRVQQETPDRSEVSRPAGVSPSKGGDDKVPESVKSALPPGAFMTADHRYYFNGEGPYPSVTTILEVMSKPALVTWKAKETARALYRGMSERGGVYELNEEEAIKWALKESDKARDTASSVGTSVHLLADMVSRSPEKPVTGFQVSEETIPYLEAFRGFLAFLEAQGGRIVSSEKAVLSQNGYAGTYDLLVQMECRDGSCEQFPSHMHLWLLDVKTSKNLYPEYGLQLSGYRWADSIILPNDPRPYPMPEIHRTGVLHLRPEQYKEGWLLVEYPTTYTEDYLTFLGCLEVYKWRKADRFNTSRLKAEAHKPL